VLGVGYGEGLLRVSLGAPDSPHDTSGTHAEPAESGGRAGVGLSLRRELAPPTKRRCTPG